MARFSGSRASIFWVQIAYLLILLIIPLLAFIRFFYFHEELPPSIGLLPIGVPWFGALGAVMISLGSLLSHRLDWDPTYKYWHVSRPIVGVVFGSISVLIFQAGILSVGLTPNTTRSIDVTNVTYYIIAFVVGYREETFRSLIKRVADVLLTPGSGAPGSGAPGSGAPGSGAPGSGAPGSGAANEPR